MKSCSKKLVTVGGGVVPILPVRYSRRNHHDYIQRVHLLKLAEGHQIGAPPVSSNHSLTYLRLCLGSALRTPPPRCCWRGSAAPPATCSEAGSLRSGWSLRLCPLPPPCGLHNRLTCHTPPAEETQPLNKLQIIRQLFTDWFCLENQGERGLSCLPWIEIVQLTNNWPIYRQSRYEVT